ncbi:MAG TPA: MATE family efflux transporter [Kofleriaceae bacterium]
MQLALPLAAQQLGFQLMGMVDAALLGRADDAALAGAGIGNSLLFGIVSIGMGVVMGLDTLLPQSLGAGRPDDARRLLNGGLRLGLIVGLLCTLAVLATPPLLTLADVPEPVARSARAYLYVRALGIVPFLVSTALRSYFAAHGITRPLLVAVLLGNVVNAALDLPLIFGFGPIPALGVVGAATATVTVQIATLAIYAYAVRRVDRGAPRAASTRADLSAITRLGAPVGGQLFAEVGIFSLATVLASHFGELSAAAHSIALNLASFTFSFALGCGSATGVRVGLAIGAGNRALARHRASLGWRVGISFMGACAVVFLVAPATVARAFTSDAAVISATVPLLRIAALFQLSDATQAIFAGALRGAGDTRSTFVGNVIGHYLVGLPLCLALAFGAHMGARGLWWGLSAGLTATAIYLVVRFQRVTRTSPQNA